MTDNYGLVPMSQWPDSVEGCRKLHAKSEWNATPQAKRGGRYWGMHKSTKLDRPTELEAWHAWLDYLREHGKI